MDRRTFLFLFGASPALIGTPAFAGWDEGVAAVFEAQPGAGGRVTVTRSGGGYTLGVSPSQFNIGMPPSMNMSEKASVPKRGETVEVTVGNQRVQFKTTKAGVRYRTANGNEGKVTQKGGLSFRKAAATRGGQFAAFVGMAAAVLGSAALGNGGRATVLSGGTTMLGNFEIQD
jgi:hypothetical protein